MLRPVSSNISIITNFGCQQKCWFCIWQLHPLRDVNQPMNWDKLRDFLYSYRHLDKFSVSGGGDCLFEYYNYIDWWDKLFSLAEEFGMKVDVHSRQRLYHSPFWKRINKLVMTSDNLYEDREYFDYIRKYCKLRIVHVATEYTNINAIEDFLEYSRLYDVQFTIKQLSQYDDEGMYLKLKKHYGHSVYFLDDGDYNIYYMPDNSIQTKFMEEVK